VRRGVWQSIRRLVGTKNGGTTPNRVLASAAEQGGRLQRTAPGTRLSSPFAIPLDERFAGGGGTRWAGRSLVSYLSRLCQNPKPSVPMPCGRKRKRHKIATHKRKKRLRKNRHKKKVR